MNLPALKYDLSAVKVADLVGERPTLGEEFVKRAVDHLNDQLAKRLRGKGPGWAIGYRLKQDRFPTMGTWKTQPKVEIEWEFHLVELVDGKVPLAVHGFHYVGLKDFQ